MVKAGDTLWDLARQYLADPFLWPLIYEANRRNVQNPHRIFPNARLIIPMLPGERVAPPVAPQEAGGPLSPRTRFYTPNDTSVYPMLVTAEAPAIARVEPREFHATPWLADTSALKVMGRLFRSDDPRAERDKLPTTFHPFENAYVTYGPGARPKVGDLLVSVLIGRGLSGYGRIIEPTGVLRVDSLKPNSAVAMVSHQFGPMRTGQVVLPIDSFPSTNNFGRPVEVQDGAEGILIDFALPQPLISVTDHAFVSIATGAVRLGDELAAYLPERQPDGSNPNRLPERPIARMLVTRIWANGATVRVIQIEEAALQAGMKVRVVRRMP